MSSTKKLPSTKKSVSTFLYILTFLLILVSTINPVTLRALETGSKSFVMIADTYVSGENYLNNYGDEEELILADYIMPPYMPGPRERVYRVALMKFDLSSLPTYLSIVSAKLYLYCSEIEEPVNVTAYHCPISDWNEYTITQILYAENLLPNLSTTPSPETTIDSVNEWYSIDVTYDLETFLGSTLTEIIRLSSGMLDKSASFSSREGDYPPYLEITYQKTETQISCQPSQSTILLGHAISLTGSISPTTTITSITIRYQINETLIEKTVNTQPDGSFSDSMIPPRDGLWTVAVEAEETEYYSSANTTLSFNVIKEAEEPETPAPPMIPGFPIEAILLGLLITASFLFVNKREPPQG
jgi:hypothetical protein